MVATKNHIPCSCSLLLLLDSQMGYTQVKYVNNHYGDDADDALRKDIMAIFFILQASQFFGENYCVSPLDFNGKTMSEMLHR